MGQMQSHSRKSDGCRNCVLLKNVHFCFERQVTERQTETGRDLSSHSPTAHKVEWVRPKPGDWIPSGSPMWVTGTRARGPSFPAFSDTLAGSWLGSGSAGTGTSTLVEFLHCRQQLTLLHHSTISESLS